MHWTADCWVGVWDSHIVTSSHVSSQKHTLTTDPESSLLLCRRPLHLFLDLAASDGPADPSAQHVHDQPAGAGSPGGHCLLWGRNQRHSALRARPLLWPEWTAALQPAPIGRAHHLRPESSPVQPGGQFKKKKKKMCEVTTRLPKTRVHVLKCLHISRWCLLLPILLSKRRRCTKDTPASQSTPSVLWTPRQRSLLLFPSAALPTGRLLSSQSRWFTSLITVLLCKVRTVFVERSLVQVTVSLYLKWSSRVTSQPGSPKTSSLNQPQLICVSMLRVLSPLKRSCFSPTALSQQLLLQSLPWRGACTASSTATRWCSSLCSHCWQARPSSSSVGHLISAGKTWSSLKYS